MSMPDEAYRVLAELADTRPGSASAVTPSPAAKPESVELDLSDPLVWKMADRNHQPREIYYRMPTLPQRVEVTCEQCWQPWPCETRRQLRATRQRCCPSGDDHD